MPHAAARIAVAIALGLVLAGCGDAPEPLTTNGARVGDVLLRDAQIAYDGPVRGGTVYRAGQDAPLRLTIINEGDDPDRLVSVSSPVAGSGVIIGDAALPGGHTLTAGMDEPVASITPPGSSAVRIVLRDLKADVGAGSRHPVEFTFERAGRLSVELSVQYRPPAR
ncbi:MAG: hypothetical protein ACRDTE_20670 [Pseudonocardiaceae bacterium]